VTPATRAERRFHAPGRANLIGEHTDHTDGLVLPAAIDRGITLRARLGGSTIELSSAQEPGGVRLPADGRAGPRHGWGRYVAAVAAELDAAGRPPVGLVGRLTSDLPPGAGLSSSAALEVVVALALCAAAELEPEPLRLAALCRRAERRAVGVPSGIMDQAASLLGRRDAALLLDCGTLEHRHVPLPGDHTLVLVDSGVARRLASTDYARRVRELTEALPVLGGRRPADVRPAELAELLAGVAPVPARRLRHVVTENERVRETGTALAAGDLERVGELFAAGHASLRDDFEVSVPELDTLVRLAVEAGATAARMTGAGFGGSIVALVPTAGAEDVAAEVVDRYGRSHPRRAATALVCEAADGARELA
jgi:galactokinase